MLQVLFALNNQYWLNEKGAAALANTFPFCPALLQSQIDEAFTSLAADSRSIGKAIAVLEGLSRDMEVLVAREYKSRDP